MIPVCSEEKANAANVFVQKCRTKSQVLANLAACDIRVNHHLKTTYKSGRQDLNLRPPGPKPPV